jgi:thiol-disulfide isomerase/thioredoxin
MFIQAMCLIVAIQTSPKGIVNKLAPTLSGVQWIDLAQNNAPEITKGEVTYLFFFQSWCPGCHSHGFPTLKKLEAEFRDDVNFIAVQTVFEGFRTNTPQRAARDVKSFGLDIPVGHDGSQSKPSQLLRRYRGGGTPWTIIIDKQGVVRSNGFRLQPSQGKEMLKMLIKESAYETIPPDRGGQDLLGTKLKPPSFGTFSSPLTLYRWWTDTCAFCEASLPALDSLREKYEDRGLKVVGVYHPKPQTRPVSDDFVTRGAKDRSFKGDVVIDSNWAQLKKWWLDTGDRSATSVSILVDDNGIVRFVHPGPVLFPSDEKKYSQENNDFHLLDKAIDALLPPLKLTEIEEVVDQDESE